MASGNATVLLLLFVWSHRQRGTHRWGLSLRPIPAAGGAENLHAGEGLREKWALAEEPEKCRRWLSAKIQKCVSDIRYLQRRTARASEPQTLHGCSWTDWLL